MLNVAAFLVVVIGVAHSVLGERYILMRLFRRPDLPQLFGGTAFVTGTLRFAWHLTTVAWFALAAVLVQLQSGSAAKGMAVSIGAALLVSAAIAFLFTRGRHLVWPVFLLAGGLCLWWAMRG